MNQIELQNLGIYQDYYYDFTDSSCSESHPNNNIGKVTILCGNHMTFANPLSEIVDPSFAFQISIFFPFISSPVLARAALQDSPPSSGAVQLDGGRRPCRSHHVTPVTSGLAVRLPHGVSLSPALPPHPGASPVAGLCHITLLSPDATVSPSPVLPPHPGASPGAWRCRCHLTLLSLPSAGATVT